MNHEVGLLMFRNITNHLLALMWICLFLFFPSKSRGQCPAYEGQYPFAPVHSVDIDGNYAYFGGGVSLVVADITDPSNSIIVGHLELPDIAQNIFVSNGYAYVAARYGGLVIVDVSIPSSPAEIGIFDPSENVQDVVVDGSYAYVANHDYGLRILDITTPSSPVEVGFCDTPGYATGITLSGIYAYVADRASGVRVIDVSTPSAPVEVGFCDTPDPAEDILISGIYAYVTAGNSGLLILDISTPTAPVQVGSYNTSGTPRGVAYSNGYAYVADYGYVRILDVTIPANPAQVGSYQTSGYAVDIDISGDFVFVADYWGGVPVLNISTPASPTLAGFVSSPWEANDVAVSGNYAFVADGFGGLRVLDISIPTSPSEVGGYDMPVSALGIEIVGDYAFVANNQNGLRILDISVPETPVQVGICDTPGQAYDVAVSGNYAFVADAYSGLCVIDISNLSAPVGVVSYDTFGQSRGVAVHENFLYLADGYEGLRILNISDPLNPFEVGFYDTPDFAQDVIIYNGLAYVADSYEGLRILDVSNPSSPFEVGFYDFINSTQSVRVSGGYAYLAALGGEFLILDISTPSVPVWAGYYATYRDALGIFVTGFYAYVAASADGLEIFALNNCCSGPPGSFTLNDPPDDAADQACTMTFDWTDSTEALSYDLYLDIIDPPVTLAGIDLPFSEITLPISPGTLYYWKVVAKNGCDTTESPIRSLTTLGAPGDFSLVFPLDGTTNQNTTLLLDWQDSANADSYELYLGTSSPLPLYQDGITESQLQVTGLDPMTTYNWYVQTANPCGNAVARKRSFTTGNPLLKYADLIISDQCPQGGGGDLNDIADPGEDLWITIQLENIGPADATEVTAVLSSTHPDVNILTDTVAFPDISAGGTESSLSAFEVVLLDRAACPSTLDFTLGLSSKEGTWPDSFQIPVGRADGLLLEEMFETWPPIGWTIQDNAGTCTWESTKTTKRENYAGGRSKYTYVASGSGGLRILDVSTPSSPVEVGFIDILSAWDIAISGNYAYISDNSSLRVVDISTPSAPVEVGMSDTPNYPLGIAVSGHYVYIADYIRGLLIFDVSVPSSPVEVGCFITPGWPSEVAVSGTYAYLADEDTGLRIIDVSDPSAPVEVGYYDTPDYAWGVIVSGSYAYVGDIYGIRIIDVTNPSAPFEVGHFDTIECWNLAISQNTLYISDWTYFFILDVSTPASPSVVGYIQTPDHAYGVDVSGSYAYLANTQAGLSIIDVSNPSTPTIIGSFDTPGTAYSVLAVSDAAVADSDWCGPGSSMDTELITPSLDLSHATTAGLSFQASYRDMEAKAVDYFHVDISTDGGSFWNNLLSWNESHDPFGSGEKVDLDLTPYVGNPDVKIRFHYVATAWDWYALVDDVQVSVSPFCFPCVAAGPPGEASQDGSFSLLKSGTDLFFSWEAPGGSCQPADYGLYTGNLSSLASGYGHDDALVCGETENTFSLPLDDPLLNLSDGQYFLVVSSNGIHEGSYGLDPLDQQRPVSGSACHGGDQDLTPCD